MAPSFFAKLVKVASPSNNNSSTNVHNPNPRERVSSDAYPAPRSPASPLSVSSRNRAQSASASPSSSSLVSPTTPTQASTNLSSQSKRSSGGNSTGGDSRIPSIITTLSGGGLGRNKTKKDKDKKSIRSSSSASRSNSVNSKHRESVSGGSSGKGNSVLEPPLLNRAGDRRSWASTDSTSTQPNVTVVPPTPIIGTSRDLDSDSEEENDEEQQSAYQNLESENQSQKQPNNDTAEEPEDVVTPTLPKIPGPSATSSDSSTAVKSTDYAPSRSNTSSNTASTSTSTSANTVSSSSTTSNPHALSYLDSSHTSSHKANGNGHTTDNETDGDMSLAPGSYTIRKQSSNKSLGSHSKKAPPPEINVAAAAAVLGNGIPPPQSSAKHMRAATAPPESASSSSLALGHGQSVVANGEGDSVTMTPIVESPTDVKFAGAQGQPDAATSHQQQSVSSSQQNGKMNNNTNHNISNTTTVLSPSSSTSSAPFSSQHSLARDYTSTSILSPGSQSQSKRPWKRSTTKKPTGLASALAASGLAMANPSLSAVHNAQIAPPPIVSPGSSSSTNRDKDNDKQPYLSRSPSESKASQKSGANVNGHTKARSADLSPRSSKSRKSSIGSPPRSGGHRSRRPSSAARSDVSTSEIYSKSTASASGVNLDNEPMRPEYYAGLNLGEGSEEGSEDEEDESEEEDESDLDLAEDIPVTGFAVASNKRNADFHELFPTVPEGDYLIEDYGCALQREILIQGRLYISENHICFHANIFGWITDLSIPIYEITSLEKKMTAFVIPNAIQITTRQAKYTFASFLSRDTTFDVIYNIWRLARPEDGASVMSTSARASLEGVNGGPTPGTGGRTSNVGPGAPAIPSSGGGGGAVAVPQRKATQCACGREGKHFSETAMEITVPGTPEKIHNLMFASGFIKDFMISNQKLLDIQMSDWQPVNPGSKLLSRNFSYIKPLNGSLGPKQTKCELKDEVAHFDPEEYISTVTTTRTPDVPSGGVFAVKTRTCIMWAGPISSKIVVTTQVEWSGRSFIKGIIERSAIDGQKTYHNELERCMRDYIAQHKSEFLPEGVTDTAALEPPAEIPFTTLTPTDHPKALEEKHPTPEELKQRERERNARGLQWAWDTFDGAWQVAQRSTKGALELVHDAWDQSSSTTILWFVIVVLVLSNLWTLFRMGKQQAKTARKIELRQEQEREKWVQSIVTVLWDELSSGKRDPVLGFPGQVVLPGQDVGKAPVALDLPVPSKAATSLQLPVAVPTSSLPPPGETPLLIKPEQWKQEVEQLLQSLDMVDLRVKAIRESLSKLDVNALD